MQRVQPHDLDDAVARLANHVTRWVLGVGLLSLHATVFTLSMVGMVLWNLYDNPNELWVADVFRRWGALLAFHAILVAAGWTAWKLMRAEQEAVDSAQRSWVAASVERPVFGADGHGPAAPPVWTAPAPPPAAGWQRYAASMQRADLVARRVVTLSHTWSVAAARWTIDAVTTTTERWMAGRRGGQPGVAPPHNPLSTWPEAPRPRTDEEEFIARFGGASVSREVTVTETVTTTVEPGEGKDVVLDVTSAPLPETPEPGPAVHVAKDPNATWVETAAATWLPRPDVPVPPATNGHHPDEETGTTPSSEPNPDPNDPPTVH